MLSQMYPSPEELADRRWGPRKYDPQYNLCKHLPPPKGLESKPEKVPVQRLGDRLYRTPHGDLDRELTDKFARHYQWKTSAERSFVLHNPPFDPKPPTHPCLDVQRNSLYMLNRPGQFDSRGPAEWQEVCSLTFKGRHPRTAKKRAWPLVKSDYQRFPNDGFPVTKLFRKVEHHPDGRTSEEREKVHKCITELAKTNDFNSQFIKPPSRQQDTLKEVRLYEMPPRTPGRNPVRWTTTYNAEFNRHLPEKEYKPPDFPISGVFSKTAVLPNPSTTYNSVNLPPSLNYLPTPWNFSKKPNDFRLIKGYSICVEPS